jgi:hypothetical protein
LGCRSRHPGRMSDHERGAGAHTEPRDLSWLAAVLDRASQERSKYMMAMEARGALGLSLVGGLPDDLALPELATVWAMEYHVETVDDQGRRRVRLAPAHEHDDGADPPVPSAVPEPVVAVWRALLALVTQPAATARLHHLLFERGGPTRREHARAAAIAYIGAAQGWERGLDAVQDLSAATRLARAVGDRDLAAQSLAAVSALVQRRLEEDDPPAGIILRALRHLVGEPDCPPEVDELLDRAVEAWPDANRKDSALALMLKRCQDDEARRQMWRRRVSVFTSDAAAATSGIMRAVRLQQALHLAEESGDRSLRQQAAAALQTVQRDDLGLMSFGATSRRYEEEFERQVTACSAGDSWQQSLVTFATLPPLSGETERNRDLIRRRQAEHPLGALFPTQLLGPEGLPAYTGTSEEDRFDVDLVRWETDLTQQWLPILASSLHEIPRVHGLPDLRDISSFLATWPAIDGSLAPALARALLRYWTGDSEGAAYTVLPRIESIVRGLVLASNRGVYRLQREHKPGQYAGLGQLLPILHEEYGLDESRTRFLGATLRHPAGLNLRNMMLHGFVIGDFGPGAAAVLLHVALSLGTIEGLVEPTVKHAGSRGDADLDQR